LSFTPQPHRLHSSPAASLSPSRMHYQDPSSSRPGGHELHYDFVLMTAIARRDPSALSRLYDRHGTIIHTLVLRILKDPALAEDCLIDIFQELWDRADRYNPARG